MSALERQLEASVSWAAERNRQNETKMSAIAKYENPMSEWAVMREQAEVLVKSKLLPKAVDTPEKAIAIIQTGRELGIGPMQALRSIHVIEGKPTMSAELMAGLVLARIPGSTLRVSSTTNEECSVEASRPGQPVTVFRFSMKDAQAAGLTSKDNWRKYQAAMLRARCVASASRAIFPDATMGLLTPDELGANTDERGEVYPTTAEVVELPRITAHQDDPGFVHVETGAFEELSAKLATLENDLGGCETYDQVLALREMLGSKAKQSQLTKDIQAAGERSELDADQRKALGKVWQRINRQVEKLEASIKAPGVEASFVDADPEQDGR